jgi:hypothetical protein
MKKLIISLIVLLVLSACSSEEGRIKEAKVVEKLGSSSCIRSCDYSIVLEKNGEQVELKVNGYDFDAIKKGNTVSVTYDSRYEVTDLKLINIQSKGE